MAAMEPAAALVGLALAFALGLFLGWAFARLAAARETARAAGAEATVRAEQERRREAETELGRARARLEAVEREQAVASERLAAAQRLLEEQRAFLAGSKKELEDAFQALATAALRGNSEQFLTLTAQKLEPLKEAVATYRQEALALAERAATQFGTVERHLHDVTQSTGVLQKETARLVTALRQPHVRGRWGEITLRRTAELAGMADHCDFVAQESLRGEEGLLRPDMIVYLPAGRRLVVDSKVPLTAYLEAIEAPSEAAREESLRRHAGQLRAHVGKLAEKSYAEAAGGPEFVVQFIPNDSFLAAAVELDPELIEWAIERGVVIATPTTFIALLRAVALGWREERLAENAARVSELGRDLARRMGVLTGHLAAMGAALEKAVESYNAAVASFESRVLPQVRKFEQLGPAERAVEELAPIETGVRAMATAEAVATGSEPEGLEP